MAPAATYKYPLMRVCQNEGAHIFPVWFPFHYVTENVTPTHLQYKYSSISLVLIFQQFFSCMVPLSLCNRQCRINTVYIHTQYKPSNTFVVLLGVLIMLNNGRA